MDRFRWLRGKRSVPPPAPPPPPDPPLHKNDHDNDSEEEEEEEQRRDHEKNVKKKKRTDEDSNDDNDDSNAATPIEDDDGDKEDDDDEREEEKGDEEEEEEEEEEERYELRGRRKPTTPVNATASRRNGSLSETSTPITTSTTTASSMSTTGATTTPTRVTRSSDRTPPPPQQRRHSTGDTDGLRRAPRRAASMPRPPPPPPVPLLPQSSRAQHPSPLTDKRATTTVLGNPGLVTTPLGRIVVNPAGKTVGPCAAKNRQGQSCRFPAFDSRFCKYHRDLAIKQGVVELDVLDPVNVSNAPLRLHLCLQRTQGGSLCQNIVSIPGQRCAKHRAAAAGTSPSSATVARASPPRPPPLATPFVRSPFVRSPEQLCRAISLSGLPCRNAKVSGSEFCISHVNFGGNARKRRFSEPPESPAEQQRRRRRQRQRRRITSIIGPIRRRRRRSHNDDNFGNEEQEDDDMEEVSSEEDEEAGSMGPNVGDEFEIESVSEDDGDGMNAWTDRGGGSELLNGIRASNRKTLSVSFPGHPAPSSSYSSSAGSRRQRFPAGPPPSRGHPMMMMSAGAAMSAASNNGRGPGASRLPRMTENERVAFRRVLDEVIENHDSWPFLDLYFDDSIDADSHELSGLMDIRTKLDKALYPNKLLFLMSVNNFFDGVVQHYAKYAAMAKKLQGLFNRKMYDVLPTCNICGVSRNSLIQGRMTHCPQCWRGYHQRCHCPPIPIGVYRHRTLTWICWRCGNFNSEKKLQQALNRTHIWTPSASMANPMAAAAAAVSIAGPSASAGLLEVSGSSSAQAALLQSIKDLTTALNQRQPDNKVELDHDHDQGRTVETSSVGTANGAEGATATETTTTTTTTTTVGEFLREHGFGMYASEFEDNAIDWSGVLSLRESHLESMGVGKIGHRLQLLNLFRNRASGVNGHHHQ